MIEVSSKHTLLRIQHKVGKGSDGEEDGHADAVHHGDEGHVHDS